MMNMKAEKLPSGNWRARVYLGKDENGKKIMRSFTAPDKKTCLFLANEAKVKEEGKRSPMTLSQAIDAYVELKSNVLSPTTVREYSRKNFFGALLDKKINDITTEDLQKAINIEATRNKPKTIRNKYGLVKSVLSLYRPNFNPQIRLPQKEKTDVYIPTRAELSAILERSKGTPIEIPILLAAFCSLRRSEICALNAGDVKGNRITINKALVQDKDKNLVLKTTKTTESTRTTVVPDFVIKKLPQEGKITEMTPNAITKRFRRLLIECEIPLFSFHKLRHFFASELMAEGIPDKYIAAMGGWKTDSTLKKVYQHIMTDQRARMEESITSHFSSFEN